MDKILITGIAGFIGCHLAEKCSKDGFRISGLDNLNDYYDVRLKIDRLRKLGVDFEFSRRGKSGEPVSGSRGVSFYYGDLTDRKVIEGVFSKEKPSVVIHMAAQAGVRYSIRNPQTYMDSNLQGFLHILECCRKYPVDHLLFASSSSVYGLNRKMPYSEHDATDHPVSLYGATKKANELMAHAYAQLYGIPVTGLRLFTVYGPYGRPDMSPMIFSRRILQDEVLEVFNHGRMERDFTYIDDVVESISRLISRPPAVNPDWDAERADPQSSSASYRILNIGCGRPQKLEIFVDLLSNALGRKARRKGLPMQKGDVRKTFSDTGELQALTGFTPRISLEEGVKRFVRWFRDYYAT